MLQNTGPYQDNDWINSKHWPESGEHEFFWHAKQRKLILIGNVWQTNSIQRSKLKKFFMKISKGKGD